MSDDFLDIFSGSEITVDKNIESDNIDLMYRPAESVFGAVAFELVKNGWSIYPQDTDRRPGRIKNETIKWQSDHNLSEKLPTENALKEWTKYCSTLNVAAVMGQGSSNAFAIDIDVLDADLSEKIVEAAELILGDTPFIRVGRAPKIALIYRLDKEDSISSVSKKFAETDKDGEILPSEDAVEILGSGKSITFFGTHHKTGRYFQWLRKTPINTSVEEAPLVTSDKVIEFMEYIDENVKRFHRGSSILSQPESVEWDENADVKIPKLKSIAGTTEWTENSSGIVVDGRETYLTRLCFRFVQANPNLPLDQLTSLVVDQFCLTADASGRWEKNKVFNEARGKLRRLLEKVKSGELNFTPIHVGQGSDLLSKEKFKLPFSMKNLKERGLDFLPPEHKRKLLRGRVVEKNNPIVLTESERRKKIDKIQIGLRNALDDFFEDVFLSNCGKSEEGRRVHLVKAPTGAGKTSQTLRYIGEKKAEHLARANQMRIDGYRNNDGSLARRAQGLDLEYENDNGTIVRGTMPIVFLLPTYSNIEEVRVRADVLNLDGSLSDEELKRQALERNIISEDELEARLSDMRRDAMNAGLKVMVYKGKIAAGCQMKEKIQAAMEAGVGTAGFCKSSFKNEEGETEEVFCEYYNSCPAIMQRDMIQEHDLIFTPHPFMHLDIPEPLKHVRAVIADERIHHLFIHTTEFPLKDLALPRKSVRLTKKERENGITEFDLAHSRSIAVDLVTDALAENVCPAQKLFEYSMTEEGDGFSLVEDALRVCSSAIQKDANISPKMTLEEVKELCAQPTGLHLREEARFWKIIQERMMQLQNHNLYLAAKRSIERDIEMNPSEQDKLEERLQKIKEKFALPSPKGERDLRIQYLQNHLKNGDVKAMLRISWRSIPNWDNVPLLLLDASAAPEIINKIWNGVEVVSHDIQGPLHMKVVGVVNRTFSNASVIGSEDTDEVQKVITGKGLYKIRTALSAVSSWFGWSRVVAGTSILLRKTINTDWACPDNVDWCHYGAMRGLDFAKHHEAAFSVGRMELPIRTIDGLVAALTYDDEDPEMPYDIDGSGMTKKGAPLLIPNGMQRLKLRSGEVVEIPTPIHPGKWGRLIQKQYREEELLQFVGRLRPVYREGEQPVWFALSSVIPDELIIDDLVHIDDLLTGPNYFWDAVRKTQGVIHPEILCKVCPEYFKSPLHAQQQMDQYGFSAAKLGEYNTKRRGFDVYKIVNTYNEESVLWIRSSYENSLEKLQNLLVNEFQFPHTDLIPVEILKQKSLARPRIPDNIEIDLGTLEERRDCERILSEKTAIKILTSGVKNRNQINSKLPTHPVAFSAGKSANMEKLFITFAEAEAKTTLAKALKEKKKNQDTLSDTKDTFEQMGNHIHDSDNINY